MKKYAFRWIIALLLASIIPLSLLAVGLSLPTCYADTYYAELPAMYWRLRQTQGRKLVIVGGSNVAFGLDVTYLEQLLAEQGFGYTVCSFGLYAAVGMPPMLDLSLETLSEGDVVILAMEPTSETMSAYFGATAFWKCAEEDPRMLFSLQADRKSAMAGSYLQYLQDRIKLVRSDEIPHPTDVYSKASFDENCSMVYDRPGNILALGYDTSTPVDFGSVEISGEFAALVNDYCQSARAKGASVYLSFSPVNRSAVSDMESIGVFFEQCRTAFDCTVISDPNRYVMDSGWFYDNNFHLNTAGARLRSFLLAEDILSQLGCYAPLNTGELPAMPEPVRATAETENGDTDSFTFALDVENGVYLVSGLSEAGRQEKVLTIPGSIDGVPVVGFSGAVLESEVLEELTVPASVENLPDRLFARCPNLTRLVLKHTDRPCGISGDTFAGAADLRVFVPQEAYSLYRDGYGCAVNPWTACLDRIYTY